MGKRQGMTQEVSAAIRDEELVRRLEDLFNKNRTAIDELRGVVAEAHGVLRDLRKEVKKAEQIGPAIVARRLRIEVQRVLEELGTETKQQIEVASERVNKRFDEQMSILLGEDDPDKPSLVEMLDRLGPLVPILTRIIRGEQSVDRIKIVHPESTVVIES